MEPYTTITSDGHSSAIFFGSFKDFPRHIPAEKADRTIIVTDTNIHRIYGNHFAPWPVIQIEAGESGKKMSTVLEIIKQMQELGADRHSFLLAAGGGVVCDITGFVASVYMRGIAFGYLSTSLLSQVDASIGGKTGINFGAAKNMIGTFSQPDFVFCDPAMLSTLPEREYINGLGEIVKHSLIADAAMFNYIRSHYEAIQRRDLTVMQHLIEHSIQIKSQIVSADLRESGLRKILNFGHTIGHALEMHSALTHGEAISVGMVMAAQLSYRRSYCQASVITGISEVLTRLGLPVQMPIMPDKLANTLFLDKKKINNTIEFIFIEEIGKVRVARIAPAKIIQLLSF